MRKKSVGSIWEYCDYIKDILETLKSRKNYLIEQDDYSEAFLIQDRIDRYENEYYKISNKLNGNDT